MISILKIFSEWAFVAGIRTVATWFAWNQAAYYFHFRPISILIAFGFLMATNVVIDIVDRIRK